MKTAQEWAKDLMVRLDLCPAEVAPSETVEVVIREAVLAERERCAQVAETVAAKLDSLPELGNTHTASEWASGAALRVAERIREAVQ